MVRDWRLATVTLEDGLAGEPRACLTRARPRGGDQVTLDDGEQVKEIVDRAVELGAVGARRARAVGQLVDRLEAEAPGLAVELERARQQREHANVAAGVRAQLAHRAMRALVVDRHGELDAADLRMLEPQRHAPAAVLGHGTARTQRGRAAQRADQRECELPAGQRDRLGQLAPSAPGRAP